LDRSRSAGFWARVRAGISARVGAGADRAHLGSSGLIGLSGSSEEDEQHT
jgi:hypothetical protein